MPNPIAYLTFDGNCAEAMRFYERALNGKLQALMTYGESPMAAQMPAAMAALIIHASLALEGGGVLMAGDKMPEQPYEAMKGFSLALTYDTVAEAQRAFNALGDGGKVTMPLQATFWAKTFGMLVDRFGTPWMVSGEFIAQ
ncbi:MAG: VOC family protein [Polaromonas sp.]